jgi:predicted Fe-Mo cluster-binding NifX family protein
MTRIALPTWEGRVSPVFDVAEHLLIVDLDGASQRGRQSRRLGDAEPLVRAHVLTSEEVDVLICGAISRPLEHVLAGAGIEVVSGICGRIDDVLRAFSLSLLNSDAALHLPGCQPAATTMSSRNGASRPDRARREQRAVTGEERRSGAGAERGGTLGSRRGT